MWESWETQAPTEDEIDRWFGDGETGICLVLDHSQLAVLECRGPRQAASELLAPSRIEIPHACPRVIAGDHDRFYFRAQGSAGPRVALLRGDTVEIDLLGAGVITVPPSPNPDTGVPSRWLPPFLSAGLVPLMPRRVYDLSGKSQEPTQLRLGGLEGPRPRDEGNEEVP